MRGGRGFGGGPGRGPVGHRPMGGHPGGMRPGPMMGPMWRPMRPFWWPSFWWLAGPAMLLLFGGSATAAYKLRQQDVRLIEEETGSSARELSEEELLAAMEKLGIEKLELTDEDRQTVAYHSDSQ